MIYLEEINGLQCPSFGQQRAILHPCGVQHPGTAAEDLHVVNGKIKQADDLKVPRPMIQAKVGAQIGVDAMAVPTLVDLLLGGFHGRDVNPLG